MVACFYLLQFPEFGGGGKGAKYVVATWMLKARWQIQRIVFVSLWVASLMVVYTQVQALDLKPPDLPPVTWKNAPAHPPVEIVRNGQAKAVVYVAEQNPSATLKRLIDELIDVIQLSTGAKLKVVSELPPADQPAIVIGECEETREAGIDAKEIPVEGFVVKTAKNRVYLVGSKQALPSGSSPWAHWSNEGTAWAVADFLERFVGVRWYWPAEVGGRSIIRSSSLTIPPVHYSDQPVFRQREFHPSYGWKLPTKARWFDKEPLPFPSGAIPEDVKEIPMASYLPLVRAGCSWPYKIKVHEPQRLWTRGEKWLEEHKEMFALKEDGSRNWSMLCYSSPKTLEFLLEGCERVWDKGGDERVASWVTSTCVTVSPADYPVSCHCSACRETIAKGGASLLVGLFVKRMCEAVKHRWPDKKVIYLPYWNYQECPREIDFPDNLVVQVCMTGYPMALRTMPRAWKAAIENLRAWRSKCTLPITTWDYSDRGSGWTYAPFQYPHIVRDWYQAVKDIIAGTFINGGIASDWTTTAPTLYVWMKVLWNPDLDVDAVLDEMCRRLFGKASDTVREFIQLECNLWEAGEWRLRRHLGDAGRIPAELFREIWSPKVVAQLKALHDKALVELADDPVARQRFLYLTWTFSAFLKEAESIHNMVF